MVYNIFKILFFLFAINSSNIYADNLQYQKDQIANKSGEKQLLLLEEYLNELSRDSIYHKEKLIRFTIKQLQNDSKYLGRIYLKLASVLLDKDKFIHALDTIFLSKDLMDIVNDSIGYGYYYQIIGEYYLNSSNSKKAINYFDSSLVLFQKYKMHEDVGKSYQKLGWSYFIENNYYKAIDFNTKSVNIFRNLNEKKSLYGTLCNLSLIYKNAHMLDAALECEEEQIKLEKELNITPKLFPVLYNRSHIYIKNKEYLKAHKLLDLNYNKLAKMLFGDNLPSQELLKKLSPQNPEGIKGFGFLAKRLALSKYKLKDTEPILHLMNLAYWAIVYTKNIEIESRSNVITSAKEKYSLEKKNLETELALTKAKSNAYEQRILLIIVVAIGLVVSLSLAIYYKSNKKLEERNLLIEKQQEKIVDSINYASKIQESILLPEEEIRRYLSDFFVFYRPKDIVSGDFYWFGIVNDIKIIAAIDCTGHGVPGAFMSMIANTLLNEIVLEKKTTDPGEILNSLHQSVVANLHQDQEGIHAQDGMDLSLCSVDSKNKLIKYAGAKNPLYLINNGEVEVLKGDPISIGGKYRHLRKEKMQNSFVSKDVVYSQGLQIYLFTDGYTDQFGRDDKKVFNSKRFKNTLLTINDLQPIDKKSRLANVIDEWKGDTKQIDDMLVLGFRV